MGQRIVATILVALMVISVSSVFLTGTAQEPAPTQEASHDGPGSDVSPMETEGRATFNETEHMGFTASMPTIDGSLSGGEWDDAAIYKIGTGNRDVRMLIMFDDAKIYIAVDVRADITQDTGDPPDGYVSDADTDFLLVTFDGDNDNLITYQNTCCDGFGNDIMGQNPRTLGGNCVDRGASATGGSFRIAGWWNTNSAGTGTVMWNNPTGPNQGNSEPFDYIQSGFSDHRTYEYSIPYTGTGDELGLSIGGLVNIAVIINDFKGGTPGTIGRIPGGANGVSAPYQQFMLNGKPSAEMDPLTENLVYTGDVINFDGTSSSDPEDESLDFYWDFDYDGLTFDDDATTSSPTHTYATEGVFKVALKVEDPNGATDIVTTTIETVEPEVAPFLTNMDPASDPTIEEGADQTFSVDYDDQNLGKATERLFVRWVLDGVVVKTVNATTAGSTNYRVDTDFTGELSAGDYEVRVEVNDTYDAKGKWTEGTQVASFTWNLTVTNVNRAPEITTYKPETLTGYLTDEETAVTFSITTNDPDGDTMKVTWYIDGELQPTSLGNNFVYLATPDYTSSGTHNIKVLVTDSGQPQLEDTITWSIIVDNVNRPPVLKTASPSSKRVTIDEDNHMDFRITATDPDAEDLEYSWFLDGDLIDGADTVSYTFETDFESATGEELTLRVDITDGIDTISRDWTISVNDVDRVPDIIITKPKDGDSYTISELVEFDCTPSSDPDGDKLTFEWNFGDDSTKDLPNAKHKYDAPGPYTVELQVTSVHNGKSSTMTETLEITIQAAGLVVESIETDKYEVTEEDTITVTVGIRNSGTIDAKDVTIKLYRDETYLLETLSHQEVGAGELEEFTFEWKSKSGTHNFKAVITGDSDTIVTDSKLRSDDVEVEKKSTPIGVGGDGEFPFTLLLLMIVLVIVVIVVVVAVSASRKKKKRLAVEKKAEMEAEARKQKEYEAQAAAAQASIYAQPEPTYDASTYAQPEAQALPPPPPPPPPAASPFTTRRAKRTRRREAEAPPKVEEKQEVTPEMAKVAAEAGVCPACGDEVEDDWTRCIFCGQELDIAGTDAEDTKPTPPPPPPPKAVEKPAPPPPPPPPPTKAAAGPACPECGEDVVPDWAKCPACSHALKAPPKAVESAGPRCPKCSEEVEADWLKCPSCSHDLKDKDKDKADTASSDVKCPECGEDVEPDWAKCPFCSKPL